MMRTDFAGYASLPEAAETVRTPARIAGATRSLAAERRLKVTNGASAGHGHPNIKAAEHIKRRRCHKRRRGGRECCGAQRGAAPRPTRRSGIPGILCATVALFKPSCKNGVERRRLKVGSQIGAGS